MLTKVLRFTLIGAISLPLLFAQTDAARMTGTVTDASGAVIPAAAVTVRNEKTGQSRKVTTDEHGVYLAPQLQPSIYSLTAAAPGMSNAEFAGLSLQVGQERTLNVTLSPSSMTTEVNVAGGDLVTVDVSSARIGANVSTREAVSYTHLRAHETRHISYAVFCLKKKKQKYNSKPTSLLTIQSKNCKLQNQRT